MSCASRMRACKFATRAVSRPPADAAVDGRALNWRQKSQKKSKMAHRRFFFSPCIVKLKVAHLRATYCLFLLLLLLLDITNQRTEKKGARRDVIRSEGDQGLQLLFLSRSSSYYYGRYYARRMDESRREKNKFFFFSMRRNRSGLIKFCVCVCF